MENNEEQPEMIKLPPKRYRPAFWISWAMTMLALGLAIVPNIGGAYNPMLAILTLTLIAIVWYTYFTYCAVNREESTIIQISLFEVKGDASSTAIRPRVKNLTKRTVQIRPELEIWIDKQPLPQSDFFSGNVPSFLVPYDEWIGNVPIDKEVMRPKRDEFGGILATRKTILIRFSLHWTDDLKEEGSTGQKHWEWDVLRQRLIYVVDPARITELFKDL